MNIIRKEFEVKIIEEIKNRKGVFKCMMSVCFVN